MDIRAIFHRPRIPQNTQAAHDRRDTPREDTMTATTILRDELTQIAHMLPLLGDAAESVLAIKSPAMVSLGGHSQGASEALPFHLDQAIDTTDQGPTGIRTPAGALEILDSWATQMADERGTARAVGTIASILRDLDWYAQHGSDWDGLADTIHDTHDRIAHITGHAPAHVGQCPHCGSLLEAETTDHGILDWATCPQCGAYIHDRTDYLRAWRDHMRTITDPTIEVTPAVACHIWPDDLTADLLRVWAGRGHITRTHTNPPTYRLTDINLRMIAPPDQG